MIYVAGPFFNPDQIARNITLAEIAFKHSLDVFVPRLDNLLEPYKKHCLKEVKAVFDTNVSKVIEADYLLADITDIDAGTLFEIGVAKANNIPIIMFDKTGNKVHNLMLYCCGPIVSTFRELETILSDVKSFYANYKLTMDEGVIIE